MKIFNKNKTTSSLKTSNILKVKNKVNHRKQIKKFWAHYLRLRCADFLGNPSLTLQAGPSTSAKAVKRHKVLSTSKSCSLLVAASLFFSRRRKLLSEQQPAAAACVPVAAHFGFDRKKSANNV